MNKMQTVRDVQNKILEIMKFIDSLCRENDITYFIMGGTALGAIRHGGFIPWDDDLDIFMTPEEYEKFKKVLSESESTQFVLQEWKTVPNYLEYAKVRMNGTTFIEKNLKGFKDLHHGIYVDIMILHKVPQNTTVQKLVYYASKFVTLYGLSQRNWQPKTKAQALVLKSLKFLPCKLMANMCYKLIYGYDNKKTGFKYCYWITPAKFRNGLFDENFFSKATDVKFEDTLLMGSEKIKEYLEYRYGNYMKLPSEEEQKATVHAEFFDCDKGFEEYFKDSDSCE